MMSKIEGLHSVFIHKHMQADSRQYFTIADDNTEYTQVSILLIVVGIFVLLIGVVGAVGALFASKVFGRIILVIVSVAVYLSLVHRPLSGGLCPCEKEIASPLLLSSLFERVRGPETTMCWCQYIHVCCVCIPAVCYWAGIASGLRDCRRYCCCCCQGPGTHILSYKTSHFSSYRNPTL